MLTDKMNTDVFGILSRDKYNEIFYNFFFSITVVMWLYIALYTGGPFSKRKIKLSL